jgi:uncharacterized membrane protein YraQ (UPF0718 family)
MTSVILYLIALTLLLVSFLKDKNKTKKSMRIAWSSFIKLLPNVLSIMLFVGITLAIVNPKIISSIIGSESGILGVVIALIFGSVTLIPSFIAFPLGGALLKAGAGYPQVSAFVSTVMAVGIVTLPMEIKYFNKTIALKHMAFSFLICVMFTVVIGLVM